MSLNAPSVRMRFYVMSPYGSKMELTQEYLKSMLDYNPDTGLFTWRTTRNGMAKAGTVAGTLLPIGYIHIRLNEKRYFAHRLAWFYVHGLFPNMIDHINRIRNDNRIVNLRPSNPKQNTNNRRERGKSFLMPWDVRPGVSYTIQANIDHHTIDIGTFVSKSRSIKAILRFNCQAH